jgi:beta-glucosidase
MTADGDAAKTYTWKQDALDTDTYKLSRFSDVEVTNQFDNADPNYYGVDFTYLSRSDWGGTFPVQAEVINATSEMMKDLDTDWYSPPEDAPSVSDFTQGADNGLSFIDMRLVDYDDDETWNKFLDQFTVDEMVSLMPDTFGVAGIDRLGIPSQVRSDDNLQSGTMIATGKSAMSWVSEVMTCRTWNKDLFSNRGYYLGIESAFCGMNEIWYGGGNIHRTPFGGRNSQYFSEDGNFGYIIGSYEAAAMQATGITYTVKHFVLNDQEAHRESLNTFSNEQAIREIYLRNCEGAFCEGGALGTMTSFNKIGVTYSAANVGLLQNVLRGEWAFKGHITTDGFSKSSYYKTHYLEMLTAGLNFYCLDPGENAAAVKAAIDDGDGQILQTLRARCKDNIYIMTRSVSVNGLSSNSTVITVVPAWQTALIVANFVFALGTVIFTVLCAVAVCSDRKRKSALEVQ